MLPTAARFYKPDSSLPVAVVSVEPTTSHNKYLVRVIRGPSSLIFSHGHTYGLFDQEELTTARQAALERLPEFVRDLASADAGDPDTLTQAVLNLEIKDQGPALDTLYELATPLTVAAVRAALAKVNFAQAHLWRAT